MIGTELKRGEIKKQAVLMPRAFCGLGPVRVAAVIFINEGPLDR